MSVLSDVPAVGNLDQENIISRGCEKVAEVAAQIEVPGV
jgi:hypothetical protein